MHWLILGAQGKDISKALWAWLWVIKVTKSVTLLFGSLPDATTGSTPRFLLSDNNGWCVLNVRFAPDAILNIF